MNISQQRLKEIAEIPDEKIDHKPIEIPPTPFGKGGDRALVNEVNHKTKSLVRLPNTSDIPELNDDFWKDAKLIIPESKKLIPFCIEKDVEAGV